MQEDVDRFRFRNWRPQFAFVYQWARGKPAMGIKERSRIRKRRIVANLAADFEDAERWDLDFWQSQTPEERLSALIALRKDVEKVINARLKATPTDQKAS
jgi:hypothetical protein